MAVVYEGRVFSVEVSQVTLPGGHSHEVAIVRHPPSVVLIPVPADDRVILIRQYRPALGREIWELPAGGLNPGETAEAAAVRECEEEIRLVPGRMVRLRGLFPAPGFCDEELIFFRVSDFRPPAPDSPIRPDLDEQIHVETFTFADARSMVERGDIVDLKSAYGLTLI